MTPAPPSLGPGRAILLAGLAAGVGDTLLAMGMHGVGPAVVYRAVAAGLIGREAALGGGLASAGLGLLLHFLIATTAAACYVVASARVRGLVAHAIPCGLAFGVAVYFFMKDVVVPLSAARPIAFTWAGLVGHAVLVGLPIALVARRVGGPGRAT